MNSLRAPSTCALIAALIGGAFGSTLGVTSADAWPKAPPPPSPSPSPNFCFRRAAQPSRMVVERPCGVTVAVFTDGARSVALVGPERRFAEPSARDAVVTQAWVRVLPAPFGGALDAATTAWLESALVDQSPDLLALAMQYIQGAPPLFDGQHQQIAGDADYGPLAERGTRKEGADFNDYLGTPWSFPEGGVRRPRPGLLHSLDCSGFIRMLWGYRGGLPLARGAVSDGRAIPRRAVQMAASAPGVVIATGAGFDRLQPGDLVLFDADPLDGPAVDHVGMFLDRDQGGHLRFISSRKGANGPTLGDTRGASILDGDGLYARSFRMARRL